MSSHIQIHYNKQLVSTALTKKRTFDPFHLFTPLDKTRLGRK